MVSQNEILLSLRDFESRYPSVFELMRRVGVYPGIQAQAESSCSEVDVAPTFTNIGIHCVAVGMFVERLLDYLESRNVEVGGLRDLGVQRALVHDLTKPFEIRYLTAEANDKTITQLPFDQFLANALAERDFSAEEIDQLSMAGKEVGHRSLKSFLEVRDGVVQLAGGGLAAKIVHLADAMTHTSIPKVPGDIPLVAFVTPKERITLSEFAKRYSWMWEGGLAVRGSEIVEIEFEDGKPRANETGTHPLGSYADLQVSVAEQICEELLTLAGDIGPINYAERIKEIVSIHSVTFELQAIG